MSDRAIVTMVRRKGDPTAPTISDIRFGDIKIVVLERPRAPLHKDYCKDGKPHPCISADLKPDETAEYDVDWTENVHPQHPACYQTVTGPGTPAPDRTDILWHPANWIRQLLGCHAPGLKAEVVEGEYDGQHVKEFGVSSSKPALTMLHDALQRKNFRLIIKEAA
jgi:hypothetical protein